MILTALLASCSVTSPLAVTDNPVGSKRGISESVVIFGDGELGVFLNPKFGIAEAAKNGGITGGISTVDVRVDNYIFFMKRTLIVTGE